MNNISQKFKDVNNYLNQKLTLITILYSGLFILSYILLFLYTDLSRFTWDSWIYYKLSVIISALDFPNLSEYAQDPHAISFPFGYPFVVSILHTLFGVNPHHAVFVNIFSAIISGILLIKIFHGFSKHYLLLAIGLSVSLYFNPFYLEEIFSGRSIPFALMLVLLGIVCYQSSLAFGVFFSGILFGLSALVRFDLLIGSLVFMNLLVIFFGGSSKKGKINYLELLKINLGFVIGISAWFIYSSTYFDVLWISNNSVVALSSIPISFTEFNDYKLMANHTVFNEPLQWLFRIIGNIIPLIKSAIIVFFVQPFFIVLSLSFILYVMKGGQLYKAFPVLLLLMVLAPHLLTGFFDERYLTFYYLCSSIFLVIALHNSTRFNKLFDKFGATLMMLCVGIMMVIFALYFKFYLMPAHKADNISEQLVLIDVLKECHSREHDTTYVFVESNITDALYAGITGNKVAFPIGYSNWNVEQRNRYFSEIAPYRIISTISNNYQCPNK